MQQKYNHNQKLVRIWQTVKLIPMGKVASYAQIADLAGYPGRARLVGTALSHPNIPSAIQPLPWHRVLRSSGQLAFPPNSDQAVKQIQLLQQEQVIVHRHRVKLSTFQWQPNLATMLWDLKY